MEKGSWFVAQNGKQTDIYTYIIPSGESPRTVTIAANVEPSLAALLVQMRNEFDTRLNRIEDALLRVAAEAEKLL